MKIPRWLVWTVVVVGVCWKVASALLVWYFRTHGAP